jgi:transcriptional regulator with XRE-family HTH domain
MDKYYIYIKIRTIIRMNNLFTLGQTIKERRVFLRLNQEDLMEMSGISAKTIQKIEMGKANPSVQTLYKLLDILGMNFEVVVNKSNTDFSL